MSQTRVCIVGLTMLLLMAAGPIPAMTPPAPGELARYQKDGTLASRRAFSDKIGNHKAAPDLVARKTAQLKAAAGKTTPLEKFPYATGLPAKGTPRVPVFLVDFSDYPHTIDQVTVQSTLFGTGNKYHSPNDSLASFYTRASYGALNIKGDVFPWYRAAHRRYHYANAGQIIGELFDHFASTDFTVYDNNGDGKIDYFMVFWAGPDTGWSTFWWSWNSFIIDPNYKVDGKTLGNFSWVWESRPTGSYDFDPQVSIHETGHALGLPDYYDYDDTVGPKGGLGGFDIMDGGFTDHNAFSKWLLDWLSPTVIGDVGALHTLTLRPTSLYPDAVAIMPGMTTNKIFSEYFLVQNRSRREYNVSNDYYLPNDGLMVWHIDATLNATSDNFAYNNSTTSHKLIRLMEASGQENIAQDKGATAADFYTPGRYFSPISTPDSNNYSLQKPAGIDINPFWRTGVTMINIMKAPSRGLPAWPLSSFTAQYLNAGTSTNWMDVGGAVDNTNLPWSVGGSTSAQTWIGQKNTWAYGGAAAQSLGVGDGQYAAMSASVTGPAPLSFQWKVSSEYGHDWLEFYLDGVRQAMISGQPGWLTQKYTIPLGTHSLKWRYVKDASGAAGSDCGWVDQVSYPYVPFSLAVDNNTTTWTHSGAAPWYGESDDFTWGGNAARSGAIADGQTSQFATTVTGPLTLDFVWKASSETNHDFLRLLVDGAEAGRLTGQTDWTTKTVSIAAGTHTLTWQYQKDASGTAGADCGWVDHIRLSDPALANAVDNTSLAWLNAGSAAWVRSVTTNHDGADSAFVSSVPVGKKAILQTSVLGPGTLSFYWMESSNSFSGELDFEIDGVSTDLAYNDPWTQKTFTIDEGWHTLTWTYTKDAVNMDYAAVDQVVFTPDWLTLGEAVDNPGISWGSYGSATWFPQQEVSCFGQDAAQCGAAGSGNSSYLEGMVSGPALLTFDWKVSSAASHAQLEFYIDWEFRDKITGEVGWQQKQYLIPKGTHQLLFNYYKSDGVAAGSDCGWVDRVITTPLPTLGEALDSPALTWNTGGSADWLGQPLDSHGGGSAARSGRIHGNQATSITTTLTGPGNLSFYWKVSSQQYWDTLDFRVDGARQAAINGVVNWAQRKQFIPGGNHTVEWRYTKDDLFTDNQDCGWLDQVVFTPGVRNGVGKAWALYE